LEGKGKTFLPEKLCMKKINKMPEFRMTIARKIFFSIFFFWGGDTHRHRKWNRHRYMHRRWNFVNFFRVTIIKFEYFDNFSRSNDVKFRHFLKFFIHIFRGRALKFGKIFFGQLSCKMGNFVNFSGKNHKIRVLW